MMKNWYKSLHRLDMNGIIFHDHLSDSFIDKYSTNQLDFVEAELGERSVNDERFYCYLRFLRKTNVNRVVMTDLFDLEFNGNPFSLMDSDHRLYMGDGPTTIRQLGWLVNKFNIQSYLPDLEYPSGYVNYLNLNTGSIGGDSKLLIGFLEEVTALFDRLPRGLNANMPVWNFVVRSNLDDEEIMHGKPWNSDFTKYEEEGKFCIRHK